MIEVGQKAPMFKLLNQTGEEIDLKSVLKTGVKVMLVIYPSDDTPGCTAQMCKVRDDYTEFEKLGVKIYGLNHNDAESHTNFKGKYDFQFDILVDEDRKIIKELGSTKLFFKNEVTQRSIILIDKDGKVIYVHKGQQDNKEILNLLKS
jgi:thioredoxin-dependent peroxiredoxin